MDAYYLEVRKLKNKFYGLEFHHVVRDNNVAADVLSKLGSTHAQVPARVFVHKFHAPTIPEPAPTTTDPAPSQASQEVMMIDVDWRQPFVDYIREQKVPTDKNLAEQIICRDNVTEPLKLIPYYCLNHSSWPLSNNIEVTCRLCRVKPGKSLTSPDRQLYIITHTKASPKINKSQIIT
jgi:hypothetical protein